MRTSLSLWLYSLLWWFLTPALFIRLWLKGRKQPKYRARWPERFGRWPSAPKHSLWVHAVSVGETIAAKPLVERWLRAHPDIPVLVTTMTPTGSDQVRALFGNKVAHAYLPWDLALVQKKLVTRLQPRALVIIETELWPNLINACAEKNVPVLLANARLSERSYRGYARLGALSHQMMTQLQGIAAQDESDAKRFVALGMPKTHIKVTGSVKFDLSINPEHIAQSDVFRTQIGDRPIWIAASTHHGEEEQILSAHAKLRQKLPNALLILVPRHPERTPDICALLDKHNVEFVKRTQGHTPNADQSVFLIDTLGELMTFYALADVAFIGNSLNAGGGHNPIEPAALTKPVLTGPSYTNFFAIIERMKAEHAITIVESPDMLANRLLGLLQSKDLRDNAGQMALHFFKREQGALTQLLNWVEQIASVIVDRPKITDQTNMPISSLPVRFQPTKSSTKGHRNE